jgi:hypothetical protein
VLCTGFDGIFFFSYRCFWDIFQDYEAFLRRSQDVLPDIGGSNNHSLCLGGYFGPGIGREMRISLIGNDMKHRVNMLVLAGSVAVLSVCMLFWCGCALIGIIFEPTSREEIIEAEYDLSEQIESRYLVLVKQPGWLNVKANMRYYLTRHINRELTRRIEIPAENLVSYQQLKDFRSSRPDFPYLSLEQIGSHFKVDFILVVTVSTFELLEMSQENYHRGFMASQCSLYDATTGAKLWPDSSSPKSVKVGFEIEEKGQKAAIERLSNRTAYCTVRYLYGCQKGNFKIADDRSGENWVGWQNEQRIGGFND